MTDREMAGLRLERQHLLRPADETAYEALYRDLQPGLNVYWCGFGQPPTLSFRAAFDDLSYNRERQRRRELLKGRFQGGNLGWVDRRDWELYAGLYRKPLERFSDRQWAVLEQLEREGPLNIQLIKEATGMLVKEITPVLHRLQEAFLVYEDQYDGEWDRSWYRFEEMFPETDPERVDRGEALIRLMKRFAYRSVKFTPAMAKSFFRRPIKEIREALKTLTDDGTLVPDGEGLVLREDAERLPAQKPEVPRRIYALHRNDFLVKCEEERLRETYRHPTYDSLQYLLIDGVLAGVVWGHFKNGPYVLEDVHVDLPEEEKRSRREEIIAAVYEVNDREKSPLPRFEGKAL